MLPVSTCAGACGALVGKWLNRKSPPKAANVTALTSVTMSFRLTPGSLSSRAIISKESPRKAEAHPSAIIEQTITLDHLFRYVSLVEGSIFTKW